MKNDCRSGESRLNPEYRRRLSATWGLKVFTLSVNDFKFKLLLWTCHLQRLRRSDQAIDVI